MNEKYTCSMCGKEYEKGWLDEEANKEAESVFGVANASTNVSMAVVCDDCYIKITKIVNV